jgi:hypothetical protein
MSIIESFADDLNKDIFNGIDIAENGIKNIGNIIVDTNDKTGYNINNITNNMTHAMMMLDNEIERKKLQEKSMIHRTTDGAVRLYANEINKINNIPVDATVRLYANEVNKMEYNVRNTKPLTPDLDRQVSTVTISGMRTYVSGLDQFHKYLFNFLIKPLDPRAKMTSTDYNIINIIIKFITLLIINTNNLIISNTIEKGIPVVEKSIGYKLDGRRIGRKRPAVKSRKMTLIMKIVKTLLTVLATLLDLILLALVNQTNIFSNIVKDLLGK